VNVVVLSVGRPGGTGFGPLFEDYAARIRRFGVTLDARYVREVKPGGRYSDAHVMEREAAALVEALPSRGTVIAVTPGGDSLDSPAFARRLRSWARPAAVFVVGGPLGLAPSFRERADQRLALSAMTLPHDLARLVLIEQIYRAVTILHRVPYHK
jgi:23S rRNA (pseudouridine1915-N3)-methyltransferase